MVICISFLIFVLFVGNEPVWQGYLLLEPAQAARAAGRTTANMKTDRMASPLPTEKKKETATRL